MEAIDINAFTPSHASAVEALLDGELGGRWQARLGELHDVMAFPGFIARRAARLVGVATHRIDGQRAELTAVAVHGDQRGRGVGRALLDAVLMAAGQHQAHELWTVTTNDNLDALRFYQRRGFALAQLHTDAISRARELKPSIPMLGRYDIPMRDELVLVRTC